MFPCKYHQNGGFSMAMLVLGRVSTFFCGMKVVSFLGNRDFFVSKWWLEQTFSLNVEVSHIYKSITIYDHPQLIKHGPLWSIHSRKGRSLFKTSPIFCCLIFVVPTVILNTFELLGSSPSTSSNLCHRQSWWNWSKPSLQSRCGCQVSETGELLY